LYGAQRPHSALAGLTPDETYAGAAIFPQTQRNKNAKNNSNRNWRLDINGAKLDPAAGSSDEGGPPQEPASHFFMKLVFAAPASFLPSFPTALASQHFFIELVLAAPASAFPSLLTALAAHAAPS
jgi:hypothetical protein